MSAATVNEITGVFVSLYRAHYRHDLYEVFKPWEKIEAVYEIIRTLSQGNCSPSHFRARQGLGVRRGRL